jgi:integrase
MIKIKHWDACGCFPCASQEGQMRLTRPNITRLAVPPGKNEIILFDEALPGFGVRVRLGGKRTWIAQYRIGSKQRRVTLGTTKSVDPDEARRRARSVLGLVHNGDDPQVKKIEALGRASITLGSVVGTYIDQFAATRLRPRTLVETRRYLTVGWKPLHALELNEIDRRVVAIRLSELARENGPIAANRARVTLSAFFNWTMREGICNANPVIGTNRAADERSRDRVLNDHEMAAIWGGCRDDDFGRIIRLLILTGQRRDEVGGMAWSELDLARGIWSIPGDRTKNGRAHEVPLPAPALDIITGTHLHLRQGGLFGEGKGPFQGWSKAKAALDRRISGHHALAPWRLHDLRRTVATRMAELGVQPHIVEAVLNHVSGHKAGVAGVYNRALYTAEKRKALDIWGEHVHALVGDSERIIALRREPAA